MKSYQIKQSLLEFDARRIKQNPANSGVIVQTDFFEPSGSIMYTYRFNATKDLQVYQSQLLVRGCTYRRYSDYLASLDSGGSLVGNSDAILAAQGKLMFNDARWYLERTKQGEYLISPLDFFKQDVEIRCTCADYRYKFAYANEQARIQVGPSFGRYVKKTDRPFVNPLNKVGYCKHLAAVLETIQKARA